MNGISIEKYHAGQKRKRETTGSLRRPPCVIMTKSVVISEDGAALKKMCEAGFEVVVVMDGDLEETLRIVETVRQEAENGVSLKEQRNE